MALLALQLGEELVACQRAGIVVGDGGELAGELGEADAGVDDHGLHGRHSLQRFEDLHGVENTERFLVAVTVDVLAQAGCAAENSVIVPITDQDCGSRRARGPTALERFRGRPLSATTCRPDITKICVSVTGLEVQQT